MKRLVGTLALVLAGCSAIVTTSGGVVDNAGWTRSANFTTCAQWSNEMTEPQRQAMAGLLLPRLRRTADTAASDGRELVPEFVQAITAACHGEVAALMSPGTDVVTAMATLAFMAERQLQP